MECAMLLLALAMIAAGSLLGARNEVRDIRNPAFGAFVAALLGSAAYAYAFTVACRDERFNDFCVLPAVLLGYVLTRVGLLLGLLAWGVALRIAWSKRQDGHATFLLVGALVALCLPLAAFEMNYELFLLGPAWSGFNSVSNALAVLARGWTPYMLAAIAPLPVALYGLWVTRHAPPTVVGDTA